MEVVVIFLVFVGVGGVFVEICVFDELKSSVVIDVIVLVVDLIIVYFFL